MPQHRAPAPTHATPAQVAQVAAAAGLGRLLRVYQPKHQNWFLLVFVFLVGLVTSFVLVGLWMIWMIFRTPNLSKSVAARRIYLYEQGFVLVERSEDPQVYRWDGIDTVFQKIVRQSYNGIQAGTKFLYTITRRDGATAKVTLFWDGGAQLGAHINERVSAALLPRAVAAIDRGQGIQFGDMTLTMDGIAGKRQSVTWTQVSGIQIVNGFVRVRVQSKTMSLSSTAAANLPNLPLFLTLANRLHQVRPTTW